MKLVYVFVGLLFVSVLIIMSNKSSVETVSEPSVNDENKIIDLVEKKLKPM